MVDAGGGEVYVSVADFTGSDEPTSGLDPKAASEFSQLLNEARNRGVAVLMATHDLFHAKQIGTKVGIMKQGRLVDELNSEDISHADLERLYLQHMGDRVGRNSHWRAE